MFLFVLRNEIVTWLYGGRYSEHTDLLLLVGLLPFAESLTLTFGNVLRAMEKPHLIFRAYIISTILTLTVGLILVAMWNINGASLSYLLITAVLGVTMGWFCSFSLKTPMQQNVHFESRN